MAIIVREKDLTAATTVDYSDNIVYVPGYATKGIIGQPILCSNLTEFYQVFGRDPYQFKEDQKVLSTDTAIFSVAGSYEKSYLYAVEALRHGARVLYERVFTENEDTFTAKAALSGTYNVEGKYPGSWYENLSFKFSLTADSTTEGKLTIGTKASGDKYVELVVYYVTCKAENESGTYTYLPHLESEYIKFSDEGIPSSLVNVEDWKALTITSTKDEFTVANFYTKIYTDASTNIFTKLAEKGDYALKYISCGAYPVFQYNKGTDIATEIVTVAAERGDCTALVDHFDQDPSLLLAPVKTWAETLGSNLVSGSYASYAAMFTPQGVYAIQAVNSSYTMPASFGYVMAMGESTSTNPDYMAVAGVARGKVPELIGLSRTITSAQAELYQTRTGVSINPIIQMKPYGYLIWGNRTLKDNAATSGLTATSFLNIRQLVSNIKKNVYLVAKTLTFNQNSDITWLNFKSGITPLLEEMLTGGGINGYRITKTATQEKATLIAVVRIYPIEALEDFDITIELADTSTSIAE